MTDRPDRPTAHRYRPALPSTARRPPTAISPDGLRTRFLGYRAVWAIDSVLNLPYESSTPAASSSDLNLLRTERAGFLPPVPPNRPKNRLGATATRDSAGRYMGDAGVVCILRSTTEAAAENLKEGLKVSLLVQQSRRGAGPTIMFFLTRSHDRQGSVSAGAVNIRPSRGSYG